MQQFPAFLNNHVLFAFGKLICHHQLPLLLWVLRLLFIGIEVISQILHLFPGKVIYLCLILIDFQLHVPCQVIRNTVFEFHSVLIILAQYQNVISIPHMNPNF